MIASLANDLGFAWRRLVRAPGYATTIVVLLAFAIGANVVLGAAVYAMRWKALPYANGDQVFVVNAELRKLGLTLPTSVHVLDRLEREANGLAVSGYESQQTMRETESGAAWTLMSVRPSLFGLLGASPALGRGFTADDAVAGRDDVVVLSHDAWLSRFQGAADVLGRTIVLGKRTVTVIGVMPAGFRFPDRRVQAWSPFAFTEANMASAREGNIGNAYTIVRGDAGASAEEIAARVQPLFADDAVLAGLRGGAGLEFSATGLRESWVGERARTLLLLQGALLLVLIAVVTNVASLMFERLLSRQQELGVRAAIGAGRSRLVVAAGAEALWLLLIGVSIGVALAPAGLRLLAATGAIDADLPIVSGSIGDLVAVGLAIAAVAALAFALIPLFAIYGTGAAQWLRPGVPSRNESRGVARVRRLLVVAQLAITTVLLSGAGLMTRSVMNLLQSETGFDQRQVVVTGIRRDAANGPGEPWPAGDLEALLAAARALPGVRAAVLSNMTPMSQSESMSNYALPGDVYETQRTARNWQVGPGYFAALGIAVREGREFTAVDGTTVPAPVIVDTLFARKHFAGASAVGQTIKVPAGPSDAQMLTVPIIGVADLVKARSLDEVPDKPSFYRPFGGTHAFFTLVLRTEVAPETLVLPLRKVIDTQLPGASIGFSAPLAELARETVADRERVLRLLAAFALVAAAVSAIGLYALMAVTVRRRAREIGVRQALGADPRELRRWVLRQSARIAIVGVVVGALGSLALSHALGASLYGVSVYDPVTLIAVVLLVLLIALLASLVPARRAARMDPQACLRAQ